MRDVLNARNISMYQLAKDSGLSYAAVHDLCTGKTDLMRCSAGTVYRIAQVLNVTMEQLIEAVQASRKKSLMGEAEALIGKEDGREDGRPLPDAR